VVALGDDDHVTMQRGRYLERLTFMAETLGSFGCPVELPAGGFYLWVPVPERYRDAWVMARDLAQWGGLLVSPGDLYGDGGAGFARLAVVQPMERLELVAARLGRGDSAA
jgi:aspartate/methionine/tyrosine aminotransferase